MKRNNKRLSGWIVLAVIALSVGIIGASEQFPPKGPLGFLYGQIRALFVEADQLAAESDDQQDQIDQLTVAVCGLSVLTDNPTPPEFCEGVVTAVCGCEVEVIDCLCEPGPNFVLESCEWPESFPHPDFGEDLPPKCGTVEGCRGTFTRIAEGDAGDIKVDATCKQETPPSGTSRCPPGCHVCERPCDSPSCCIEWY